MITTSSEIDIAIDRENVCSYIGYGADSEPAARIASLVDEYVENAHNLIEHSYWYVIKDIERVRGSSVFIEDSIVFESEVIARLLERCCKVGVLAVTIGDHLEEMTSWLSEHNHFVQAALLEAIGSDVVEKVADFAQGKIAQAASKEGLVVSRRFSPGYCDWDIKQQKMLFRLVDENRAGIHLTDNCLMIPRKSISGIIGIGPSDNGVNIYNPCKTCDQRNCREGVRN